MISEPRPLRAARRILVKALLIITGIIGAILLYFLCERVFAGYPQYGTDMLTYVGLTLVMATGGAPRVIDQRPIDSHEPDAGDEDRKPRVCAAARPRREPAAVLAGRL